MYVVWDNHNNILFPMLLFRWITNDIKNQIYHSSISCRKFRCLVRRNVHPCTVHCASWQLYHGAHVCNVNLKTLPRRGRVTRKGWRRCIFKNGNKPRDIICLQISCTELEWKDHENKFFGDIFSAWYQ